MKAKKAWMDSRSEGWLVGWKKVEVEVGVKFPTHMELQPPPPIKKDGAPRRVQDNIPLRRLNISRIF